ncbi:nuclear RNA export factor 2-like [Chironomus tepperi]|uniref:nuclear RNA export factor 2-like n=1 Tax=Chironomus tepperi TaxID=113505 RepID=UPI00391FC155
MNNRNHKIRRRDYTTDVYDNFDHHTVPNSNNFNEVDRVKFQNNEIDIILDRKISYIFTPGRCGVDAFSVSLLMSTDYWHSVTVHHNGLFTKGEISAGLEEMVDNKCFIPVAYISGRNEDTFYIYNQPSALQNMIKKNLETVVTNKSLKFTLKLGVGSYVKGHLNPIEKIDFAIVDVISKYRELRLDFSYFDKHRAFVDMQFSLKNYGCFDLFCDRLLYALHIDINRNVLTNLKILVLVGNKIKHLQPLSKLSKCKSLQNISLKNNLVESIEEFESLKFLNLKLLSVAGNLVITNNESINANKIMKMLPTLEKLDIKKKNEILDPPIVENIITPNKSSEDVVKSIDIDENFKNDFPRREFIKAFWSKVVIEHNGRFNSEDILNEMFETFFQDIPCYICYYKTGELEDSFMLYMNFAPMNILVLNDLKMKMKGTNEFVTFRLHLKCSTFTNGEIKWSELIGKVVNKRINSSKLDLSFFKNDSDFKDLIFCMKAADVKKHILNCALNINPKIIEINLSNNDLNSLKGLSIIKSFPDLISLNLSQNDIESLIGFPENLRILELNIDQNPLCDKFKNPLSNTYDYVKVFIGLCPQLQYIDGRKIDQSFKMIHMQNYYTTSIAHNTVEYFLNYFFKNFDDNYNRFSICDMLYKSDSILSVTSENGKKNIKIGNENIKEFYREFGNTEHDFITMTVDTPMFNHQNILIIVNGVFKQKNIQSMNDEDKIFTFSRSFVLRMEKRNNGKKARTPGTLSETYNYEIQNEIFNYAILNDSRIKIKSFKKIRATEEEIELVFDNKITMKNELSANMELFRQTTLLSEKWCQRILEDANGDFMTALNYFLEMYKLQFFKKDDFKF